mmetsp:Transcript_13701/g.29745  ORF Transcript_13701/g.29745 Transcript_13701/m.29745 type:complete len:119 (-) Transcript_13701:545-901(-)
MSRIAVCWSVRGLGGRLKAHSWSTAGFWMWRERFSPESLVLEEVEVGVVEEAAEVVEEGDTTEVTAPKMEVEDTVAQEEEEVVGEYAVVRHVVEAEEGIGEEKYTQNAIFTLNVELHY